MIPSRTILKSVFVSSTFQDLQTYRKAAWTALANYDVSIRGMEAFGARKESPLETCIAELEQSDIYIGIIAFRHGSIEPNSGKSYTQLEYDRAIELTKDILIYLVDEENARFQSKYIDREPARERLDAFKRTLRERHTVESFVDEKDLESKLRRDLDRLQLTGKSSPTSDDSAEAAATLSTFFLLPKTVAGSSIRIRVRVEGTAYPASRRVCKTFNFDFGATVGLPVVITDPPTNHANACDLFIGSKLVAEVFPVSKGDVLEIVTTLHFSDTEIDDLAAIFRTRSDYRPNYMEKYIAATLGEVRTVKADSALALELSRIISITRAQNPATI